AYYRSRFAGTRERRPEPLCAKGRVLPDSESKRHVDESGYSLAAVEHDRLEPQTGKRVAHRSGELRVTEGLDDAGARYDATSGVDGESRSDEPGTRFQRQLSGIVVLDIAGHDV